jgi:hypothetical protein
MIFIKTNHDVNLFCTIHHMIDTLFTILSRYDHAVGDMRSFKYCFLFLLDLSAVFFNQTTCTTDRRYKVYLFHASL